MCGIAGFCDLTQANAVPRGRETALQMVRSLTPRGPDGEGVWTSPHCTLAHRRLAIIDPAGGGQPMTARLGERVCALCYNGELYNTVPLRRELEEKGHIFLTRSDTEVVLRTCMEYGPEAGRHLEGIFAFAFWDGDSLLLLRDRWGVKPLFYAQRGETLVFASEPKALFHYPGLAPRADRETWQELLALNPARTPGHGIFAGLREVKPGCLLLRSGAGTEERRWYRLESRPHQEGYEETVERVRDLLAGAIRRQLVSDVPLATLLSGGLDSSVITAVAAKEYEAEGRTLSTYSFDYEENRQYFKASSFQPDGDWHWVERMTEEFATRHTNLTCPQQVLTEQLEGACYARDLPGMADVDASLLWFCRQISPSHRVVLSGECADEVFGGYPWFHRPELMACPTFPWSIDFEARTSILRPELVRSLDLEGYARFRAEESRRETPYLEGEQGEDRLRREVGWLNLNWFMASLLERKDRMSMASGLEVRVPFCDHSLIEYVWNIPWEMKSRNGERKHILRQAARGLLPEDVRLRPKSPYPKTHHPRFERSVRRRLEEILADPRAPIHAVADRRALEDGLLRQGGDYGRPWFGQLMAGPQMMGWMVQLNGWMVRFGLGL